MLADERMTASLTACVAHVLGVDASKVPGEGGVGLGQWLALRNLGLVPVESPEDFEWPGRFLGLRRGSSTWAVFFGAPPGVVFDPVAEPDGGRMRSWTPPSCWRSATRSWRSAAWVPVASARSS